MAKPFTTIVNATELIESLQPKGAAEDAPDLKHALEMHFIEMENRFRLSVEAQREASIAVANAQIAGNLAVRSMQELLRFMGEHCEVIANEPQWLRPYRNQAGHIIFECLSTQKDLRKAIRATHKQMNEALDNPNDFEGLFGNEEDGGK